MELRKDIFQEIIRMKWNNYIIRLIHNLHTHQIKKHTNFLHSHFSVHHVISSDRVVLLCSRNIEERLHLFDQSPFIHSDVRPIEFLECVDTLS